MKPDLKKKSRRKKKKNKEQTENMQPASNRKGPEPFKKQIFLNK